MDGVIYFDLNPNESRTVPLVNPLGYLLSGEDANISYLRGIKIIDKSIAGATNLSINGDISTSHDAGSSQFTQLNNKVSQTWSNLFIGGDPKGRIKRFYISAQQSLVLTMDSDVGMIVYKYHNGTEYGIFAVSKNSNSYNAIWRSGYDYAWITKSSGSRDVEVHAEYTDLVGFLIS